MLLYTESPELSLKVLSMELKTVTDPIKLGVGLGVPQHRLEIIRMNNPQGLCVKTVYHHLHMCTHRHRTATV